MGKTLTAAITAIVVLELAGAWVATPITAEATILAAAGVVDVMPFKQPKDQQAFLAF
jgi:hypothetical protein